MSGRSAGKASPAARSGKGASPSFRSAASPLGFPHASPALMPGQMVPPTPEWWPAPAPVMGMGVHPFNAQMGYGGSYPSMGMSQMQMVWPQPMGMGMGQPVMGQNGEWWMLPAGGCDEMGYLPDQRYVSHGHQSGKSGGAPKGLTGLPSSNGKVRPGSVMRSLAGMQEEKGGPAKGAGKGKGKGKKGDKDGVPSTPPKARAQRTPPMSPGSEEGIESSPAPAGSLSGWTVIWCDEVAFKAQSQVRREQLEAMGLRVKAHKTAERCIRSLDKRAKKQSAVLGAGAATPKTLALVTEENHDLIPYLMDRPFLVRNIVFMLSGPTDTACEQWAARYPPPMVSGVVGSWEEGVDVLTRVIEQYQANPEAQDAEEPATPE